jgi:hypothetical protein
MRLRQYAYLRVAEFLKVTNHNSLNVLVCSVVDPVVRNIAEVRRINFGCPPSEKTFQSGRIYFEFNYSRFMKLGICLKRIWPLSCVLAVPLERSGCMCREKAEYPGKSKRGGGVPGARPAVKSIAWVCSACTNCISLNKQSAEFPAVQLCSV